MKKPRASRVVTAEMAAPIASIGASRAALKPWAKKASSAEEA